MEKKKIRLSMLLSLIVFLIGVMIKNLFTHFSGVGIVLGAVAILTVLVFSFSIGSSEVRKNLIDFYLLTVASFVLCLFMFCYIEWGSITDRFTYDKSMFDFVDVYGNIYSIISLIFFLYGACRYICEANSIKLKLFEIILGHETSSKKSQPKQNKQLKEVINGDLMQKPNSMKNENKTETNTDKASNESLVSNITKSNETEQNESNFQSETKYNQVLTSENESLNAVESNNSLNNEITATNNSNSNFNN